MQEDDDQFQWFGGRIMGRACESGGVADYYDSLSQDRRLDTVGILSMFLSVNSC